VLEDCTPEISTSGIEIQVESDSSVSRADGKGTKILRIVLNVGGRNFSCFLASFNIANRKATGVIEKYVIAWTY
jgi:hypothetical protein